MSTEPTSTGPTCPAWDHSKCEGTALCPPRCPRFVDKCGEPLVARPFRSEDLDGLVRMYRDYDPDLRSMGLPPARDDEVRSWLERLTERGKNFVALDGDDVIGHTAFAPTDADEPEFVVFVSSGYVDRGIGTELTRQTIAYAAEMERDALTLSVDKNNARAVVVYRHHGFEVTGAEPAHVEMRLSLADPIADEVRLPPAER